MNLRKIICWASMIVFLVSSAHAMEDPANATDALQSDAFLSYIASNKVQLIEYICNTNKNKVYRYTYDSNTVEKLKIWDVGQVPSRDFTRELFYSVNNVGLYALSKGKWIDDKIAISFFVAALRSKDTDMFERAKEQLKVLSPTALTEYEGVLIEVARKQPFACPIELLSVIARISRTPSTEVKALVSEQPKKYAENPRYFGTECRVPLEILARIGDQDAERELILAFQRETNGVTKCALANKLGYAASSNALRTIAQEFRNPLVVGTILETPFRRGGKYSMRYAILRGLRQAFPDDPLFTSEMAVAVKCVEEYDNILLKGYETKACYAPVHAYFDKVEAWMTSRYNVKWNVSRPQDITLKQGVTGYTPFSPDK